MRYAFLYSGTVRLFFILLCFALFPGCGSYRFVPEHNTLPEGVKSISIPFFKNDTYEANIESYFSDALINEFVKNKQITVASHGADATLYGIVKEFSMASIAYSREDRARQYRAYVVLELTLTKNESGEIIWRRPRLVHDEEYAVEETIALTDANKKSAIQKIAVELAEQIYEDLALGF
ncbi:MAG: LptE family protein [Deltaproteobacteria bacterium]|nr:LptE family protein [Deltaproteobacteria bacterium]